jgi:hypothetical protein
MENWEKIAFTANTMGSSDQDSVTFTPRFSRQTSSCSRRTFRSGSVNLKRSVESRLLLFAQNLRMHNKSERDVDNLKEIVVGVDMEFGADHCNRLPPLASFRKPNLSGAAGPCHPR